MANGGKLFAAVSFLLTALLGLTGFIAYMGLASNNFSVEASTEKHTMRACGNPPAETAGKASFLLFSSSWYNKSDCRSLGDKCYCLFGQKRVGFKENVNLCKEIGMRIPIIENDAQWRLLREENKVRFLEGWVGAVQKCPPMSKNPKEISWLDHEHVSGHPSWYRENAKFCWKFWGLGQCEYYGYTVACNSIHNNDRCLANSGYSIVFTNSNDQFPLFCEFKPY